MRENRDIKRKLIFGTALAAFFAAMVFTSWFVVQNARDAIPTRPYISLPPTTAEEVEQEIPAVLSAAAWNPTPLRPDRNTAVMRELDVETALELVDRGFRSVVLPAIEDFVEEELAQVREILNELGEEEVFRTLTLTPVDSELFPQVRAALAGLIADASFDAILLPDISDDDETGRQTTLFTNFIQQLLDEAALALPLFFELNHFDGGAYREAVQALAEGLDQAMLLVDLRPGEAERFTAWARELGGEAIVAAVLDVKSAIPNGSMEETLEFFGVLQTLQQFSLALREADFLPENSDAANLLKQFFSDNMDLSALARGLTMLRPVRNLTQEQTITTLNPTINFTGSSNPLFPLLLNGEPLQRNDNGDYSIDMPLQPGRNTFTFEHQGQRNIIHVMYEVTLFESVSPTGRIETTGGVELTVHATALRGSTVTAALAGNTITLRPGAAGNEEEREEADSDFTTFEGTFRLPDSRAAQFDVGTVVFTANYRGIRATRNGSLVVVLPEPPPPPPPPTEAPTEPPTEAPATTEYQTSEAVAGVTNGTGTTGTGTTITGTGATTAGATTAAATTATQTTRAPVGNLLTPATNHGLGTAQMVEITAAHAQAQLNSVLNNRSVPTQSPLPRGTFDYVIGRATIEGSVHYLLASGKRVRGSDLRVINNGFRLPHSHVHATGRSENGTLALRMDVDWRIPFNVALTGQAFSTAHAVQGLPWGVRDFHATGLDITFFHTSGHSGNVDFSGFPLISGARWSQDRANSTVTLHLTLSRAGRFFGWSVGYEGNQLVIRLSRRPPATLQGAVIAIDAGHGGRDPGALFAPSHPTIRSEAQMNLIIANMVRQRLEAQGATVLMTRTTDVFVSLEDRAAFTRRHNPDMFVSIHGDASTSAAPMGTSAFYFHAFSQPLAAAIQSRLVRAYRYQIYTPANFANYRDLRTRIDRGVRFFPYAVTRVEEAPAVLVEVGFVSNLTEGRVLQNEQHQNTLAQAIVDGIADYLRAAQ